MLTINRVLGTALAAGALLLVGLTSASAQAATPPQASLQATSPQAAQDFYGTGWAFYSQALALNKAAAAAASGASAGGYPSSECVTVQRWLWPTVAAGQPVRWNAEVELQCTAPAAANANGRLR